MRAAALPASRCDWAHPVLVVGSFVDESRYRGTCYRACEFETVGPTEGFKRASRDFYQEHGQPKRLYLGQLRPGACRDLRRARLPKEWADYEAQIPALKPLLNKLDLPPGVLITVDAMHCQQQSARFITSSTRLPIRSNLGASSRSSRAFGPY